MQANYLKWKLKQVNYLVSALYLVAPVIAMKKLKRRTNILILISLKNNTTQYKLGINLLINQIQIMHH